MENITKEKKGDTFEPSITSISLFLSLNLSALIHDLKLKWKYKRKEEENLHYTTLKIENLA